MLAGSLLVVLGGLTSCAKEPGHVKGIIVSFGVRDGCYFASLLERIAKRDRTKKYLRPVVHYRGSAHFVHPAASGGLTLLVSELAVARLRPRRAVEDSAT